MKKLIQCTAVVLALMTSSATAACYADYKAKRDNPLKLHYGVIELADQDCSASRARQVIAARISQDGWKLLNVLGTFDESGLDRRRGNAGQFFLRY